MTDDYISLADDVHYRRPCAAARRKKLRRRPVVLRIGRRVHKSSGIPRALIIPLVRLRHRGTQITAVSVINPSAIRLGKF